MSKEELEKLEREKYVVERKLTAAMHKEKRLQSELKRLTRSERTHRLCTRAGMLETFLKEPTTLTDDDVMELLTFIFHSEAVQKKLDLLIANRKELGQPNGSEKTLLEKGRNYTPPKGCALRSAESPLQGADYFRSLLQSYRGSYTSPALALPTTPLWTCRRETIASNHSPTASLYSTT